MLAQDRNTPMKDGQQIPVPLAASVEIFAGSLVMVNDEGYAVPGQVSPSFRVLGRAENHVDNRDGQDGDLSVNVRRGKSFKWKNHSGDAVTQASLGSPCFVLDDETVAGTHAGNTRAVAGIVLGIEADGVWVSS